LHTISFNYPPKPTKEQKDNYYIFFNSLKNVLPCGKCRDNLKKNLKKHPLRKSDFKDRETLSRWVYKLHNVVNTMLGKKNTLTYCDVRTRYENFRARCGKPTFLEDGCIKPMYGVKSRCVLQIEPDCGKKCEAIVVDKKCIVKKNTKYKSRGKKRSKKRSKKKRRKN